MLQGLALRTDKDIAFGIEGEGLAGKQAAGLLLAVQHRDMRRNVALRELGQKGPGAVSLVRRQTIGP
jgi:hypothetical protein